MYEIIKEENKMKILKKSLLAVFAVIVMTVILCFGASALSTGSCGKNVTYTYNSTTKELVISGTGAMKDCFYYGESFFRNSDIKSVVIKKGVTTIGDYAFYDCNDLQNVTIPDGVTSIGESAFEYCDSLQSVTIPNSVTTIGDSAFFDCNSLQSVTIPNSVTTIGSYAFRSCVSLQSVTIPDSVTSIGDSAFAWCESLQNITVDKNNKYYCSDKYGVLFDKNKTKFIQYPIGNKRTSYTIPNSVTTICSYAFYDCDSLQNIAVDKNNKYYSSDKYGVLFDKNKTKLIQYPIGNKRTAYTIPDSVTTLGDCAFYECESLKSVTIPDSVTTIGSSAFSSCDSLKSVTIPDSVTTIGSGAFYGCIGLRSVTIPDSVTTIGYYAFYDCESLENVYYKGTEDQWENISMSLYSFYLTEATIHYHYNNHTYSSTTTTKKATTTANGRIFTKCTVCGSTKTLKTIYAATSITLSKTKYIYDGKNKTPAVTIKDSKGKKLVKGTDYKLTVASKRSAIGRYTVKVTFMGNYSGTKNLYFYVLPGKPSTVKSSAQTLSAIKLTWSKVAGASGYTIYRYSPSKKAYVKEGTTEDITFTVKSLYAGKKYTFKVVAYGKTASGKVYNSETYALLKTATKTKTPILSDTVAYKGKVKLFWTATTGETGYTVYYSTSKTSGFKKYKNYESNSGYVNNLTSGKTYYFKIRTYIKTDSGYVYSAWSNIKVVKVK